jgi:glutamine synthetase
MEQEQAFREIQRSLGRVEGKLEAVHDHVASLARSQREMNGRVDELESVHDKASGYKAAMVAVAGVVAAVVSFGWKVLLG